MGRPRGGPTRVRGETCARLVSAPWLARTRTSTATPRWRSRRHGVPSSLCSGSSRPARPPPLWGLWRCGRTRPRLTICVDRRCSRRPGSASWRPRPSQSSLPARQQTDESGRPTTDTSRNAEGSRPTDRGPNAGAVKVVDVPAPVVRAGLKPGDTVRLVRNETTEGPVMCTFDGVNRMLMLWLMTGLFVLVVFLVARLRGLLALVGLGFAAWRRRSSCRPPCSRAPAAGAHRLGGHHVRGALPGPRAVGAHQHRPGRDPRLIAAAEVGSHLGQAHRALDEGSLLSAFAGTCSSFQGLFDLCPDRGRPGCPQRRDYHPILGDLELRSAAPEQCLGPFSSAMRIRTRPHRIDDLHTIAFAYPGEWPSRCVVLLVLYDRPLLDLLTTGALAPWRPGLARWPWRTIS